MQMMNLLDPDIPLEYLIPIDLPYAENSNLNPDFQIRHSFFKMYDSRGRPMDTKFKIFQTHDDHKTYQKPQSEPTIPKSNSLLSYQPLRLQNTDPYSDMAKTLGLYKW